MFCVFYLVYPSFMVDLYGHRLDSITCFVLISPIPEVYGTSFVVEFIKKYLLYGKDLNMDRTKKW